VLTNLLKIFSDSKKLKKANPKRKRPKKEETLDKT
jgi:hypothetical protein